MPWSGATFTLIKNFANGGSFTPADADSQFQEIGNKVGYLDQKLNFAPVPALPTTGLTAGQLAYYQNAGMLADGGYRWPLQYSGVGGDAYPWKAAGAGAPMYAVRSGIVAHTLASGAYVFQDMDSTPTVPLPLNGEYEVHWGCRVHIVTSNIYRQLEVAVYDATNGFNTSSATAALGAADGVFMATGHAKIGPVVAGSLKLRIAGNNTTAGVFSTSFAWLSARPVRVAA